MRKSACGKTGDYTGALDVPSGEEIPILLRVSRASAVKDSPRGLRLPLRRDQPGDLARIRHAARVLVREDLLPVYQHLQLPHGQAHFGLHRKFLFNLFLEAPGLFADIRSNQSTLDLNLHGGPPAMILSFRWLPS
jgi:hypothetical protein